MEIEQKLCPGPPGDDPCPDGANKLPWDGYCKPCGNKVRRDAARRRYRKRMELQGKEVYGSDERVADERLDAEREAREAAEFERDRRIMLGLPLEDE